MSGLKTKISFPFLKHFTDSGSILVNRAEVVIPSELGAVYYPLSSQLFLKAIDAAGNPYFPIDFLEASGYYGGYINSTGDGYTFNITRHIQEYLNGVVPNADFVLQVAGNGVNASRAVLLNGANSSKIKLRLSYTKIK
jgi:hypothetical protein